MYDGFRRERKIEEYRGCPSVSFLSPIQINLLPFDPSSSTSFIIPCQCYKINHKPDDWSQCFLHVSSTQGKALIEVGDLHCSCDSEFVRASARYPQWYYFSNLALFLCWFLYFLLWMRTIHIHTHTHTDAGCKWLLLTREHIPLWEYDKRIESQLLNGCSS